MFVCTVSPEHTTFELVRDGSARLVLAPVGYEDSPLDDVSYFASVGIDSLAGGGAELFFAVIKIDHVTGEEHRYLSGRDTISFILGSDREKILAAVCLATQLLIDAGIPDEIDVVTYDENPPDRAVIKHFAIMGVFERNGYEIHTFDPYHGRRYWKLVRSKA